MKVQLFPFDGADDRRRFFVKAVDEDGEVVPVAAWKHLLFFHHRESVYGTMLEVSAIGGAEGVLVNGWELVTLFSSEPFNRFIEWDWDDLSQVGLAAGSALYDAVVEHDWLPDFAAWESSEEFRWAVPERVLSEFGPGFWEQKLVVRDGAVFVVEDDEVGVDGADGLGVAGGFVESKAAGGVPEGVALSGVPGVKVSGAGASGADTDFVKDGRLEVERPLLDFIKDWYNQALDAYLEQDAEMKQMFGERLAHLRELGISARALAHYFDEESWRQWIGLREDPTPFTVGLQLEEPAEAHESWSLSVFLRGKTGEDALALFSVCDIEGGAVPREWLPFVDRVEVDERRLIGLFPWLEGKKGRLTTVLTEFEAWEFLTEASETLVALGVEILLPAWWQAMKTANLKVKARVKGASSRGQSFVGLSALLDYDWRFSMNGVELSEAEFQQMVDEKRRLVFVRGRWIKLDPQFIRQIQDLMKKADKEGLHVRDLLEQELLSDTDDAHGDELENPKAFAKIQIELNRQWRQLVQQLNDTKEIPLVPVPSGFVGELRPYQELGMSWLWFLRRVGFGACLADDMGLGKTVQLLSYLLLVKSEGLVASGPALIVCPTSVLGNWQKEIERFAPEMRVYLHYGSSRLKGDEFRAQVAGCDLVLTSYGLTHLDFAEFESVSWSTIAIDEAQNIKNAGTKQSRAVRKLRGGHHIALTGTPMENRLSELWSIFDFINHGYLGSLPRFQKQFVAPIEKDGDKDAVERLQGLIRPFLLRRTKKDEDVALDLPDKLEQKEYCPLTAEQASLYEQLVKDTFSEIESLSGFERKGLILQMLGRLKQLCNHPALYLKEPRPAHLLERSSKLEKLVELVDAVLAGGESCLIFTQYIEMGEMIRKVVRSRFGVEVPFLNGSVPKQQRDVMIERFQEREFPVFLLSLKAGGTGLNLTAANHVIHYDRWWNPAVENQATDRAYRIGQDRFVHVHKLISTGTLEEKIDAMLEKKQSLNEQIIQSESWITELGDQELEDLLSLG
ncbi:DEAD/DEAH box helicase [Bacillus sp. DNRA2]|uniref:DEAD/DEAH box helicase n=1 Tax=Bacillus sp. DNRA2 TaxID=2723053 RepID=UPI00145C6E94|nr:DEAD/DEAH box helicase [Bacillus sp. DNRA2]NMD70142.1 DEAD/DEAH box helicase [Bacillus sp. DNRA2]